MIGSAETNNPEIMVKFKRLTSNDQWMGALTYIKGLLRSISGGAAQHDVPQERL